MACRFCVLLNKPGGFGCLIHTPWKGPSRGVNLCQEVVITAQSLGDRTDYAKNPDKTEEGELVTAYQCDPFTVDEDFMLSKRKYEQSVGR